MTACPSCGTPVEAEDRFCGSCGVLLGSEVPAPVEASRFCTRCGGPLEADDRFCGRCGAPARQTTGEEEPADKDFFADWNIVFAEEPPPSPRDAVTEAVPRPAQPDASDTSVLPTAPEPEQEAAPGRPPRERRHPPPRGFPWGASVALLGAVAVIVSAVLPWTAAGRGLPREIPARQLIDAQGAATGVNLGIVLLVVGAVGAMVALLTMVLPWLGFLRRLVGLLTLAIPVLFVLRTLEPPAGLGDLIDVLGVGVYAAAAGAVTQIAAGMWRR